jgi:LPXTG-site transpeptidase (sortase) family protein
MGKRPMHGWMAGSVLAALLLSGCGTSAEQQTAGAAPSSDVSIAPSPTTTTTSSAPPFAADGSATADDGAARGGSPTAGSGVAPDASGAAAGRVQDPTSNGGTAEEAAAVPVRVRIPSIGVDAPLETLSVDADNALQPPVAWDAAGWYDQSPVPGERGPSVIAGHLVAPDGPAVFVDLASLVPGDPVDVERADGSVATFTVDRTISAERTDSFPTSEIYGPTPDAQLRLITCDGEYDPSRGHWTRNMVVFASEAAA